MKVFNIIVFLTMFSLVNSQCGIDEYGRQFCNNTPQCTTHPDGSVSCVV